MHFMNSRTLIGSGSGRNFSILPANPGGFVTGPGPCFLAEKRKMSVLGKTAPSVLITGCR